MCAGAWLLGCLACLILHEEQVWEIPTVLISWSLRVQVETPILSDWSEQFRWLSLLHSRLVTVTEYMEEVIKTMCESWEDGLLVMDTKLANYSSVSVCVCVCVCLTTRV